MKKASIRVIFHSETKKNCTSTSSVELSRIAFLTPSHSQKITP
ncbi:hypothetical protein [Aquimarina atlantica]|nr:hypothetical protein [Aquimarina atlantica]